MEQGMHSGEGIHGCSIYTGTGGVAFMFLRLAEGLQQTRSLIAQHPQQPLAKLTPECLLRRAEAYGHWAKHLSHHPGTTKVPISFDFNAYVALTRCTALCVSGSLVLGLAAAHEAACKHSTMSRKHWLCC